MGLLVQLILGGVLIVCFLMGIMFFAQGITLKGTGKEQSKKALSQFLIIDSVIFVCILIALKINNREGFGILIIMAFIYTLFANIPIAIIAAIINFFVKKSQA
ncbi:MAG: hypothetical protein KKC84_08040 [Candidatus Omnitrophica bacterium]|nr:hypothetical protein [Candidatus Omnitrophota bacterium]